jgi:chromosome segregation ATPase
MWNVKDMRGVESDDDDDGGDDDDDGGSVMNGVNVVNVNTKSNINATTINPEKITDSLDTIKSQLESAESDLADFYEEYRGDNQVINSRLDSLTDSIYRIQSMMSDVVSGMNDMMDKLNKLQH